ncbi:MAG: hypothetical protein GY854_31350 [Deltaproteobacteria bacterium]|nr:hypothetical protein [Deltaproteobacteria bacterium]
MDSIGDSLEVSLSDLLEGSAFQEVLENYYNMFDVSIRVFDEESDLLAEVVRTAPVCRYIGQSEAGLKECTRLRLEVKSATGAGEYSALDCMCGLRYAQAPIIFQNATAGKIVLGPFLPSKRNQALDELSKTDSRLDTHVIEEHLGKMRKVSDSAVKKIITALVSVVDVILFSAHRSHVTSQMHIASIRESYRELTDKNRELEEMNEQIQELEHLKANFLATVSHELRTPLTSIIGYSDMLTEGIAGELDEEQAQFVQTIRAKGDELLGLIHSILDFSRIETGHLNIVWVKSNPMELVEDVVKSCQDMADRRGARLVLDVAEDLPEVYLDPEKVRTAVRHIIQNGVKFSPPGGVVKVALRTVSPDEESTPEDDVGFVLMTSPEMLEIAVEDFGTGIAEGDQSRIFSPFTQLDNSSTREHGGSGLGLAVVKHYIEAQGGQVQVSSRLDEGSKFTIWIPIVERD